VVDEEGGELRLEAGAVADFVDRVGLPLAGGPELVDQVGNAAFAELHGRLAEMVEGPHQPFEWRGAIARFDGCRSGGGEAPLLTRAGD
jgi:hypothetical protein